ncbi:Dishevelled associated activator of morphogenesis 2, partial [Cichlidogyrus casuarinus]
ALEEENLNLKLHPITKNGPLTFGKKCELEVENIRIKSKLFRMEKDHSELIILREETADLKQKVDNLKEHQKKVYELEAELEEERTRSVSSYDSSSHQKTLHRLERENQLLNAEKGEIQADLKSTLFEMSEKNQLIEKLEISLSKAEKMLQVIEEKSKLQESQIMRLERRSNLYRSLSESVENLENAATPIIAKDLQQQILQQMAQFKETFEQCDQQWKMHKSTIDDLVDKIKTSHASRSQIASLKRPCYEENDSPSKQGVVVQLREKLQQQESDLINKDAEIQDLKNQLKAMVSPLLLRYFIPLYKGDFQEENTQIVHFKQNPYDSLQKSKDLELTQLRKNSERLRQRCTVSIQLFFDQRKAQFGEEF